MCDHPPFLRPFSPRHPSRVPGETEENTMLAVKPRVRCAHDSGYCPSPSVENDPTALLDGHPAEPKRTHRQGAIRGVQIQGVLGDTGSVAAISLVLAQVKDKTCLNPCDPPMQLPSGEKCGLGVGIGIGIGLDIGIGTESRIDSKTAPRLRGSQQAISEAARCGHRQD